MPMISDIGSQIHQTDRSSVISTESKSIKIELDFVSMPLLKVVMREVIPHMINFLLEPVATIILLHIVYSFIDASHASFLAVMIPFNKLVTNFFVDSFSNLKAQVAHHIRLSQYYAAQIFATTTFVIAIVLNLLLSILIGVFIKNIFSILSPNFLSSIKYMQIYVFASTFCSSLLGLSSFLLKAQQSLMQAAYIQSLQKILYIVFIIFVFFLVNSTSLFPTDKQILFIIPIIIEVVSQGIVAIPVMINLFGMTKILNTQITCSFKVLFPVHPRIIREIFRQFGITFLQVLFEPFLELLIALLYMSYENTNLTVMTLAIIKCSIFFALQSLSEAPNRAVRQVLEPLLSSNLQLGRNDRIMKSVNISFQIALICEIVIFMIVCGLHDEILLAIIPRLNQSKSDYAFFIDDAQVLQYSPLKGLLGTGYQIAMSISTAYGSVFRLFVIYFFEYALLLIGVLIAYLKNVRKQYITLAVAISVLSGIVGYLSLIDSLFFLKSKKQKILSDLLNDNSTHRDQASTRHDADIMEIGPLFDEGGNFAGDDGDDGGDDQLYIRPLSGNILTNEPQQVGVSALDDIGHGSSNTGDIHNNSSDPINKDTIIEASTTFQKMAQEDTTSKDVDLMHQVQVPIGQPAVQLLQLEE